MDDTDKPLIRVATLDELKAKRTVVVQTRRCPLLVAWDGAKVVALDNRCPHLGFPLHRGTIADGILTCHWHHARFDLASGGTFDLWADDIPTAEVQIKDGVVWVGGTTRYADGAMHWRNRLRAGMEHNIRLVMAKAILGLLADGVSPADIIRDAALFGVRNRDGWGTGLTTLVALAALVPKLPPEETYLALYQGISRVAADCEGHTSHRERQPLAGAVRPLPILTRWLRHWTQGRQRDGAERTLLTALAQGASPAEVTAMMLMAASDRYFADGGHALDFINKAFESLESIGWSHASAVLPLVIEQMVEARGGEELISWRHPVDLVALCETAFSGLPDRLAQQAAAREPWTGHASLAAEILHEDPQSIIASIETAITAGAQAADLARALAYAAALRVARFGTSNEFSDWVTAHHVFTYCNALHQMLKRIGDSRPSNRDPLILRGVFHGAMRLWMIRFLNVPAARIPGGPGDTLEDLPADPVELQSAFLAALDRRGEVQSGARLAARYLTIGHPVQGLLATLAQAGLREDAEFHTYQMLEAAWRQAQEWGDTPEAHHILIAAARYIAAHAPTARAQLQTATVARRLSHGLSVHEASPESDH
ncbi:MAG TPA: Rieske 2Fe-2S domain-containing protein [Alphaproteobacteria bacterium]|nr:Rieske 2Fe-2S domain-containing protein [Alphaproteobacteria bacterium]